MLASRDTAWKRQVAAAALLLLAVLSLLFVFKAMDSVPDGLPGVSGHHWLPVGLAGGFLAGFLSLAFMAARRGSWQRDIERRRHSLIDSLPDGVLLVDAGGTVMSCNSAAARLLQLDRRRVPGMNISDPRLGAIQAESAEHPAMLCLRTGLPQSVQIRLNTADSGTRWLKMRSTPMPDIDGSGSAGVLVSLDDITGSRDEIQDLRNGESRLRLLLEGISGDAVVLLDAAGRITSWNAGAERITGYAAAEIVGSGVARLYPSDEVARGRPEEDLHAAAETGRCQCEGWRLRKDGSRFWADVVIDAVGAHAGRPDSFVMVARDHTARREEQVRLQASQQLHRSIFESAPMAFIATDPAGVIRQINGAAERLLWYKSEDLAGQVAFMRLCDVSGIESLGDEPAEAGAAPDSPFEALVTRARSGFTDEHECALVRKDGSRVQVQLAINSLRDADGAIEGFLAVATDISQRKRREDYARHVAYHDPVTGLPNRSLLNDRLKLAIEHAKRDNTRIGMLMLDIDHFKRINDLLGTPVGDQVLATIAQRLASSLRGSDTVARIGGDEFVVLLPDVTDAANAERLAATMLERLAAPTRVGREELHLSASIGVAVYPDHGRDAHALMQHAETALHQAKGAGRRCYRVFNPAMERAGAEKLVLENALRRALRMDEFALHYQPQVSLDTGEVVGVEALVRWRNPIGGLVSPARFIPAAEDNGLIVPIGEWVLRTACTQTCRLQDRTGRPLQLAVNLSPRQLRQPDLVDFIARTLQETGFPASLLEIEITEGVLMEPSEEHIERLHQLRALGVSVAVDDFGTGYSSLSYITRFPIDTLKIDRSFISRVTDKQSDAAVTQAIIALSQSLRTRVVAEGVETAQQLLFLREHHRDLGRRPAAGRPSSTDTFSVQGYHFSRAVPFEALAERFSELQDACGARLREAQ
ncbi:MAG: EAL domain-containing protein [Nevskia sp.]|nr:EAL domain-containing protein [Nevskia sp.]